MILKFLGIIKPLCVTFKVKILNPFSGQSMQQVSNKPNTSNQSWKTAFMLPHLVLITYSSNPYSTLSKVGYF